MSDRNRGWLVMVVMGSVWAICAYGDMVTIRNRDKRIDELCDLCNQLTLENVDLKIRLKEPK